MIYMNVPNRIPGFDYNRTALVDKSSSFNFNAESYILHELDPENNGDELVVNRTGNRKNWCQYNRGSASVQMIDLT